MKSQHLQATLKSRGKTYQRQIKRYSSFAYFYPGQWCQKSKVAMGAKLEQCRGELGCQVHRHCDEVGNKEIAC